MTRFNKPYFPYILIKDLKFNFESLVGDFFDTEENKEEDIIYTNAIDEDIVTEFNDVELYCNTYNPSYHTSLSYSFVMDSDNKYVTSINKNGEGIRPENALVKMYVDYYSTPKLIYSNTIKVNNLLPEPVDGVIINNKNMAVGNICYNLRYCTADVTLYEL